jgi:ATP-dependent RNA helicase DeaD
MTSFTDFNLPPALVATLEKMQITTPTPIQAATIPEALKGLDLLASAQTGSGKTVAYLVPLVIYLSTRPNHSALILAPTRELAIQVHRTVNQLSRYSSSLKMALLIGGDPLFKQIAQLRSRPQLIVGTPGRITDHLTRKTLFLDRSHFLIIDEVDRMLDMGFDVQLEKIFEYLPESRQTLMFSATLPPYIEKLAKKYLKDPQRISIGSSTQPALKIKQDILHVTSSNKFPELLKQLDQREGSIIVFVKTKQGAERLSRELRGLGYSSNAMHGDLSQKYRNLAIQAFLHQKSRIMVATDIAARGLDIPRVMHVINYNLPESPEDYIHRIGRTGRAGLEGNALCLVSPEDNGKWRAIFKMMNPSSAPPPTNRQNVTNAPSRKKRPFRTSRPFHKERRS